MKHGIKYGCNALYKLKGKGFIVRNHSDIKLTLKDNTYEWNTH